jgi:hypothetical protein
MTYQTPASTLSQLKLLNPADAIRVLRQYTEQELSDSWAMVDVLDGLDRIESDLFEAEPNPRFVIDERFGACSWVQGAAA